MASLLTKLILGPGQLVVNQAHIEGEDHQMTVRMLINALFWGFVVAIGAFLVMT
jgi:hypothetical protein